MIKAIKPKSKFLPSVDHLNLHPQTHLMCDSLEGSFWHSDGYTLGASVLSCRCQSGLAKVLQLTCRRCLSFHARISGSIKPVPLYNTEFHTQKIPDIVLIFWSSGEGDEGSFSCHGFPQSPVACARNKGHGGLLTATCFRGLPHAMKFIW